MAIDYIPQHIQVSEDRTVQALPPKWQMLREKEAILADETLIDLLGEDPEILDIQKVEGGYLVLTDDYQLRVDVIYLPRSGAGPARFALSFGEVEFREIGS